MTSPKISVVMSVYNGEKHLREAVESILNQTFADFEFIIINDGSTDNTKELLESFSDRRICLFHQENIGLTKSLNRGLNLAKGEYIARMDADDVSTPDRFEKQLSFLKKNPETGILGTAYQKIDANGQPICTIYPKNSDTLIRWYILFYNAFCHSSVLIRKNILTAYGLMYDESVKYSQDLELWIRLLNYTRGSNLKEPLHCLRVHENSISHLRFKQQEKIAEEISFRQIHKLMGNTKITIDQILYLRKLILNGLPRNQVADLNRIILLLNVFNQFSKQTGHNRDDLHNIRWELSLMILNSLNRKNYFNIKMLSNFYTAAIKPDFPFMVRKIYSEFLLNVHAVRCKE